MADPKTFSEQVIKAVDIKTAWYNENVIPKLLEEYRIVHTCTKNLFEILVQRSLVKPDPYKLDKKISQIQSIENGQYVENEKATIIGARFSDYESMLDYICTYYKFSIDNLSIAQIKRFIEFNAGFQWTSFSENNTHPNTRGLANLVADARRGAAAITASSINDIISKCSKSMTAISAMFKDITEYQKENYKCQLRKNIFEHPKFDTSKAFSSPQEEMAAIRKLFPAVMGKEPFYGQLVEEIIKEDQGGDKESLQAALMEKLKVKAVSSEKKSKQVDTKEILMTAVHTLSGIAPQLATVHTKFEDNYTVLQNEHNSILDKLKQALRKAFNIPEKPVLYSVIIRDTVTNTSRKDKINFHPFMSDIKKKSTFYESFSVKQNPGYKRIESADETKILEFLNRQISDLQKIFILLTALDEFFKQSPQPENRGKIKGIKIELIAMKNIFVTTNQRRAEYISYIEEQEQMRKLGITNDE